MNKQLQNIIENKYNVIWTDTPEYIKIKNESNIINDPELLKKLQSYILNTDPLYYTFHYKPLINIAQTLPNVHNLFQFRGKEIKINNHLVLENTNNRIFFKGMKTFYRSND